MNRETGQTTDANSQGEINAVPNRSGTMPSPAALSKMTSGSETLRDHDFEVPEEVIQQQGHPAMLDTNKPPPEDVRSGGKQGTITGDSQKLGEVGVIMNQDGVQPDFQAERG